MTNAKAVKAPVKRKMVSLDSKKARAGWFFCLPFILGFLLIYLPIIFDSVRYSFSHIVQERNQTYHLVFVGFENYQNALFTNPDFVKTLTDGITALFMDIPAIVIFSLFVAILLNQKMFGRAAFRAIFFIPVILSTGLIAEIDASNAMLDYMSDPEASIDTGVQESTTSQIVSAIEIEALFANMKIGEGLTETVVEIVNNIFNIVNRSGVQMLIFLAALQSISPAIYESCKMDGATGWETFWKITFPMISPMILVNGVYTIIDSFTSESNQVMNLIARTSSDGKDGNVISSAMAWMYFLIVLLIIGIFALLAKAFVFYQRRD
ncbi:MAG: sugar ABC transporter permease [Ruminococcaceae bacterium]|nr:sugar ABC transporter permease [Oscillospiraceae bacterium]